MYDKVIQVYKKCGQTPLDCINEVKKEHPEMIHLPLTYAGRLDPLAEGVLLILVGDECLKKDDYLSLPKEYEISILFGFETDTYDLMGIIKKVAPFSYQFLDPRTREEEGRDHKNWYENFTPRIQKTISKFIGRINQAYPPYSSRTVNGKPLFQWARDGKLDEITIPSHEVFVENIEIVKEDTISGFELFEKIKKDINRVNGDFRQKEIISIWNNELKDKLENQYKTITLRISCGGGVYVRSIAHELGKSLGVPALALNIKRTKIGEFLI
jgi:tRNA pseudouridine55 synthase